ncbi:hypothetical protein K502DRAFT_300915 [Neoconidiobolus thromboides FSU 785]|nr:hypothetical protein K502DRAFT_300915 [Neoconidiobolus thromboides FSU 785]
MDYKGNGKENNGAHEDGPRSSHYGDYEERNRMGLSSVATKPEPESPKGISQPSHREPYRNSSVKYEERESRLSNNQEVESTKGSLHQNHREAYRGFEGAKYEDREVRDPYFRSRDNRERERGRDTRDYGRRERRERSRERLSGRVRRSSSRNRGRDMTRHLEEERRGRRVSRSRSARRGKSRSITPIHKKKRKLQLWDVRPAGYEGMTAEEVKATGHFPLPGQITALKLAGALGGAGDTGFPTPFSVIPNAISGQAAQNLAIVRQQRRIYVGNIPLAITEPEIAEFFNTAMIQLRLAKEAGNPVSSVSINHDKNYAFVEFRNHDEATAAMAFDGATFRTQALKIRRPKDYVPPDGDEKAPIEPHRIVPGIVSTNVQDTPNKIFIGGIPAYFNEEQVMELLKAFGELRSFNLVKDITTGISKGFAFCEYMDPNITDLACQGLNGMEVGDKKIMMQRASIGAPKAPVAPVTETAPPAGSTGASGLGFFSAGTTVLEPSEVLIFLNMVTPEDLENDLEFEDIKGDIKDECDNFGKVLEFQIPRVKDGFKEEAVGKVYVRFQTIDQASNALRNLTGRKFLDRTVLGSYYSVAKFEEGIY